ncbi:circadian clock protein KaiC|uniref:non-specific serine/threonine protein kinase n=1 Tax=Dendrosporobacter quercicolus TaxID=146817 RepID=A0A1G9LLF3_9FIRM|nr:circadian clock protein KaiC [Dendrosporobacter quercicolus]NSL46753.1 circadian clock protein KaiC [Dendrosporobacter quercicolus DSM 1736]SDL62802.1 circadian clock protein KaiC [Dendrosporobacter quercicolus]
MEPTVIQRNHCLQKTPTGIQGFDEITYGGLPRGRAALVCGAAGCGKTLFAMQFLVNGAVVYNEPGVFMSFEENETELAENFASLGLDLNELSEQNKILMDHVFIDRSKIVENGEYDLEGLFVRLDAAINSIGAKRVVLDTIEALFSCLNDTKILRAELRRLFRWLKEKGVTTIITGERGPDALTRHGIEEYVSDCVIVLDHTVVDNISTRHVSIVKYRGSAHGTNEYPFLIDEYGICIMPITSVELDAVASTDRISTGVPRLDTMLGADGFYVGSSVLISGTAGTGKTTLAAHMVNAACCRGEKSLYFALEESPNQIIRNIRSVGIDLQQWVDQDLLYFLAARPTCFGLEMHLVTMYKKIIEINPRLVIVDSMSDLVAMGSAKDVKSMLTRLLDFLKHKQITLILLELSTENSMEQTKVGMSSLADTWIALRDIEFGGERNRGLYILKSRGMAHSNQIREFVLTERGINLLDVYTGPDGVLTGSARLTQEAKEKAARLQRQHDIERRRQDIERKRKKAEATISEIQTSFEAEKAELESLIMQGEEELEMLARGNEQIALMRKAD